MNPLPTTFNTPSQLANSNPNPRVNQPRVVSVKKNNSFVLGFSILLLIIALCLVGIASAILINPSLVGNVTGFNLSSSSSINSSSTSNLSSSQSTVSIARSAADFTFVSDNSTKTPVQVVESVLPSVLSIRVRSNTATLNGSEVAGTGYVVSGDGLVITNKHVISLACQNGGQNNSRITALSSNQKAYELKLLTVDPINDIAILQIDNLTETIPKLSFADSSQIKLGSDVLAIGNVLGQLENTVTKGIVSGLNRSINSDIQDDCTGKSATADGLIQTDAAINKGNSGGPLFNAQGDVIGMNTYGTTDAQNVGLAIPSNTIVSALNSYNKNQQIIRPRLGIVSRPLDPALKLELAWLPVDYGEIIFSPTGNPVTPGSAAATAGLSEGDILLEVDGQKIQTTSDNPSPLKRLITNKEPDTKIELTVLKANRSLSQESFTYTKNSVKVNVTLGRVSLDLK